ncbi:MAG TPA: AAA family ATPase [Candidatus Sumerlaeota bacterium]|nr:AAA family ATPase [Candidatus Sumerlaeota bacterium]
MVIKAAVQQPPRFGPPPAGKQVIAPIQKTFGIEEGRKEGGFKLGIYGAEGIGKSSLAASCPGIIFADIEEGTKHLDVKRVKGIECWEDLRLWVQSLKDCIAGIDSMTRAEDWAAEYVIRTKKANDGTKAVDSLEDFKYKAGLTFVTDEFKRLLADIDCARKRGVSFVLISHLRVSKFNNPDGSNFLRNEPRLIDDPKASNMLQFVQFLDHLVFLDLDKNIVKGKATGSGTRTIYLDTSPSRLSKSRGLENDPILFDYGDTRLWEMLGVIKG